MSQWTTRDIPDQRGRVAIVTGANSGLGLETARGLAGAGARVTLACRNTEKGEAAAADIRRDHTGAALDVAALDLADLASVKTFAERFQRDHDRLDVLVNNAGVMALPERRTVDGFEMQIGTNHLGHFALTGCLLDTLGHTDGARLVTVSSLKHLSGRIDTEDLNWERRRYKPWPAYNQAKLANLVFALELQRRLDAAGWPLLSVAAHPGYAATQLQYVGPRMSGSRLLTLGIGIANTLLGQSQAKGALPSLYAATAPGVAGGEYFGPDGPRELWGYPKRVEPAPRARKQDTAQALWAVSERLTGVRYPV